MTTAVFDAEVRLAIYRWFEEHQRAPSPVDLSTEFSCTPQDIISSWKRLAGEPDAIVLLPGSEYLWMAEPFSAVPTSYVAEALDGRSWFGNCVWDALGVLAALQIDGRVRTHCKASGSELILSIAAGSLASPPDSVVHFAVPAADWWRSIGFT